MVGRQRIRIYHINVVRLELLQTRLDSKVQTLGPSAAIIALLHRATGHIAQHILGANDHLIAATTLLQPFADPFLALAALVDIGCIDEVASQLIERVQVLKCAFLSKFAELGTPVAAEALKRIVMSAL